MLNLPKSQEREQELNAFLKAHQASLASTARVKVARIPKEEALLKSLAFARKCRHLIGGFEKIEDLLEKEEKGLTALKKSQPGQRKSRITRLLIITNDGSDRFYRACESLLERHENRVLGLLVDMDGMEFGNRFFGKEALVKLALITHKDSTSRILSSLLNDSTKI